MHTDLLKAVNYFITCHFLLVLIRLHEEPNSVTEVEINLTRDQDKIQKLVMLKVTKISLKQEGANLRNKEFKIVPEWTAEIRVNATLSFKL